MTPHHDNWKDNLGQALADAIRFAVDPNEKVDWFDSRNVDAVRDELLRTMPPIDMILHCPACGEQHIDAEDHCEECPGGSCMCVKQAERWTNPPHRSHLCHGCGHIWRPADVPTNGVAEIKTKGKNDSPIITPPRTEKIEMIKTEQAQ